jgi:hypothetical protein
VHSVTEGRIGVGGLHALPSRCSPLSVEENVQEERVGVSSAVPSML